MRLIDADDLDEKGIEFSDTNVYVPIEAIWNAPTIEAEPVVHGEWRLGEFNCGRETVFAECSVCDAVFEVSPFTLNLNYNYCPNCGAKMKGENDE